MSGGPAFPDPARAHPQGHPDQANGDGMTLRDYFAGQALAGSLSRIPLSPKAAAIQAYAYADAMLAQRAEEKEDE
mgnify:CR=1 FL=1